MTTIHHGESAGGTQGPTVATLLRLRDLDLRLVAEVDAWPEGSLDRPIRWVHSSDLVDPTPFLAADLALLTTGTQFTGIEDDESAHDEYVHRLVDRGVRMLGFGTEVIRDGVPAPLARACREQGLPLVEVPYRTPFIAVARANAELIAAQEYARRTWALSAQRAVAKAALMPDALGSTVAELSRQLDGWVGLFDAAGALTHHHPRRGVTPDVAARLREEIESMTRRLPRSGATVKVGDRSFRIQTLVRDRLLRGALVVEAGHLDDEERSVVASVVALAGVALEQQQVLALGWAQLRAGVLKLLEAGSRAAADRIGRDLWGELPTGPIRVALAGPESAVRPEVVDWLEARRGLFFAESADGLVVVIADADAAVLDVLSERFDLRLGSSVPVGYDRFTDALDQARSALERGRPGVTRFDDRAAMGLLSPASSGAGSAALARAVLAPLTDHDANSGTDLVATLRAWLEADCGLESAAGALGVHRHTVRARIALAGRLLDLDLDRMPVRAELWAALQHVRV